MTAPDLGRRGWRRTGGHRGAWAGPLIPLTGLAWWSLAFSVIVGGPALWTLLCALAAVLLTLILVALLGLRCLSHWPRP